MLNRWDASIAQGLTGLDLLVYVTQLLGADEALVLHGGGNTSAKFTEPDLLGRPTRVLRIKGSGWNLATIAPAGFAPCRQADLEPLLDREDELDDAAMVAWVEATLLDPKAPRPSIETLLHAFIPEDWILHSHADAILTLSNSTGREATVRNALGQRVCLADYRRPGHRLSQLVGQAYRANPGAEGVVLMNHGLVTWGKSAEEAYARHIGIVQQAEDYLASRYAAIPVDAPAHAVTAHREALVELLPRLRGQLSHEVPQILRTEQSPLVTRFVEGAEVGDYSQRGTATPDHLLFTKRVPLLLSAEVVANENLFQEALEGYAARYAAEYQQHRTGEFPMLEPTPRVALAPSLAALITIGGNAKEAARIADIYRHTMPIILGAESLGGYRTLDPVNAHHAEYWPLELYKRTLAPPPSEMEGRIALVTGAGSGIGRAMAVRLAQAGAHVACVDLNLDSASETATLIKNKKGYALGIAGDVSDESAVTEAFARTILEWGGCDIVMSNAGIIVAGDIVDLSIDDWEKAFAVNSTGHFLICRAAMRVFQRQGMGGSIVLNCSKNVPLPGGGFGAYSASKAAETQLGRILAIEGAPLGVRVNMLHPDGIFGGSQLWADDVKAQRASDYGIPVGELPEYYRNRNLLKVAVTAEDVAEAAYFLASPRARATTGGVLTVDGGLPGAFSR